MRRILLVFSVAVLMAVMIVAMAAPAFAGNGKAYGWGANPGLCEAYPGNGCGWHGHP